MLATAAVAALAVGGLAGCRTNVGTAATVGDHKISESDVNTYLTTAGPDASVIANARKAGQDVAPKTEVLQFLVQEQLFTRTLASTGGVPGPGQLSSSHDAAAQLLLQTQLAGAKLDEALAQGLSRTGLRKSFAQIYLRVQELEYALIKRKKLSQFSALVALVGKANISVSVSPRYGKWDPSSLQLDRKGGIPGYLALQPTPGKSASQGSAGTGNGTG